MIVTVTLNASIDKAYQIAGQVEPGTVTRVQSVRNTAGGKGLNVARVAKLCGERVAASGLAGGHTGALLEELAARDGLECRFVRVSGETRCCINVLDEFHNSTEFLEPGAPVSGEELARFLEQFDTICGDAQAVTLSGSVPKGVPADIYRRLTKKAKRAGRTVILDTSGELLKEGIRACPDMIKPNREELSTLLGRPVTDILQAAEAAELLRRQGIGRVAVSLGGEGALLAAEEGVFLGRPPALAAVNAVGCGDSMVAAFAVACRRGYGAEESLRFAVAVSAASAADPRTGYFAREEFERIFPRVSVEKLE